jgi:cytochrome c
MKFALPALLIALCTCFTAQADEPIGNEQGAKLLSKYNCQTCHTLDKPLAGPSLRDISKRYASDPNANGELEEKILNGSAGAWGPSGNIMPATTVPEEDLKPLIEWILSIR